MSFEIGVFDYLMNIDENFLFVKSFDVVYVLELIKKMVWVCERKIISFNANL